ncbi:MAG: glycosyltransferase [Bacillus sp. (in: Bacteria)]|nr:glycosyltransferase [Bacillus sp. (in: firmicutes)]
MLNKVSIVVPIYKVEKYIHKCVDSILNQTYSNLEIILVDDGSPDKCGEIIDEYLKKDNRIKVVHKENGGLSDARNIGVQSITGEYTLFVDSDDWIENKMIEEMIKISQCYKADVVQSAFYYAYEDYLVFDRRNDSKEAFPEILDNPTLMHELVVNQRVKNFAWGKLYKSEIIKDIPFEKGVLFEDVFWAHKIMHRVSTYVIIHQPLYYYYQRSNSIVATYTPRNLDIIKGLKQRHTFLEEYYEDLLGESYKVILRTSLIHYHLLFINRKKDKGGLYKKEIQSYIKNHGKELMKSVEDDQQLRYQLFLFRIHPSLNMLFLLIRKLLRMIKIIPQPLGLERVNR